MSTNKKCFPCNFSSFYASKKIVNWVNFMFEIFTEGHVFYDCWALLTTMSRCILKLSLMLRLIVSSKYMVLFSGSFICYMSQTKKWSYTVSFQLKKDLCVPNCTLRSFVPTNTFFRKDLSVHLSMKVVICDLRSIWTSKWSGVFVCYTKHLLCHKGWKMIFKQWIHRKKSSFYLLCYTLS